MQPETLQAWVPVLASAVLHASVSKDPGDPLKPLASLLTWQALVSLMISTHIELLAAETTNPGVLHER